MAAPKELPVSPEMSFAVKVCAKDCCARPKNKKLVIRVMFFIILIQEIIYLFE